MATEAIPASILPSPKARLLKFLAEQSRPISAKEAAVHLDSRTSSASELLERCAAQGLCARGENDRPRMYSLTEAGRARLRSLGIQPARPNSEAEENDSRAGEETDPEEAMADVDRAEAGELLREVRGLREDLRDWYEETLAERRSEPREMRRADGRAPEIQARPEEAEELARRADALARDANEKRPEKLRAMLLRDVDALRQAIASGRRSHRMENLVVVKPMPRFSGLGRRKKQRAFERAEAAFTPRAIEETLRGLAVFLGGPEKLVESAAGGTGFENPQRVHALLLERARAAQKLFERAREAGAFEKDAKLARDEDKLSAFFAGLVERLPVPARP